MRATAKRFVPDALVDVGRALGLFGGREWEFKPLGWNARSGLAHGWNDPSIALTQVAKWPAFVAAASGSGTLGINHEAARMACDDCDSHNTVMSFAYVVGRARTDPLRVLDWGGGLGHYYVLARALWPDIQLRWTCKDVAAICEQGAKLVPDVRFVDDDACLSERYDLVMASSSLQYAQDWRRVAGELAAAANPWLYLARLPIVLSASSFPVVQDPRRYGYQTRYVGWFLNRSELLGRMASIGMELEREFLEGERPFVRHAPERGEYRGFLFRRSAPNAGPARAQATREENP
jgi:putative methyltransferase (TIGR04325 family)